MKPISIERNKGSAKMRANAKGLSGLSIDLLVFGLNGLVRIPAIKVLTKVAI
jgi:hypothetical protein